MMLNKGRDKTKDHQVLEVFLAPMDSVVQEFAERIGAQVSYGYHDYPDRKIFFKNIHKLEAQIDIAPRLIDAQDAAIFCVVGACTYKDYEIIPEASWMNNIKRKHWHSVISKFSKMPREMEFRRLLEEAFDAIQLINEEGLQD